MVSGDSHPRTRPGLVSVIVPALNAERHLPDQLAALAAQDYRGDVEVVVADNGSTDATVTVARRGLRTVAAGRVIHAGGRRSPGGARNAGARHARGQLLAFTDADDVAAHGWLSAMVDAALGGDVVAGSVDVERMNDPVRRSWHRKSPREKALDGYRFLSYASGTSTAVWADAFHALGGYDEALRSGEDIELSWRAQLAGMQLVLAPEAVVHERLRERVNDLARQHYRYGQTGPALFSRYAAAGMPRSPIGLRVRTSAWVAANLALAPLSARLRGQIALEASYLTGRLVGSARNRVLFP